MAGYTIERIKQIAHDIANSWYFRSWALFWLLGALTTFSALIILSSQANFDKHNEAIQTWVENASSIQLPNFHFRLNHRGDEVFSNLQCIYDNTILAYHPCQAFHGFQPPQNQCLAIWADAFTIYQNWNIQGPPPRIQCTAETFGSGPQDNLIMAFSLEGQYGFGGGPFSSTFFAPNDDAWIMLELNMFKLNRHTPSIPLWQQSVIYHSTNSQPNFYNVSVMLGSFFVNHWEPKDIYNGWMTIGNIGGVAFFMVCIQAVAMVFFGIFLTNNSTFLDGTGDKGY